MSLIILLTFHQRFTYVKFYAYCYDNFKDLFKNFINDLFMKKLGWLFIKYY